MNTSILVRAITLMFLSLALMIVYFMNGNSPTTVPVSLSLLVLSSLVLNYNRDPFSPEIPISAYYVVMIFFGLGVLACRDPQFFHENKYGEVMFLSMLAYGALHVGIFFSKLLRKKDSSRNICQCNEVNNCRYQYELDFQAMFITLLFFFALSAIGGIVFVERAGAIPILSKTKNFARVEAFSIPSNGYFFHIMQFALWAFLVHSVVFFYYKREGGVSSARHTFVSLCLLFGSFVFTASLLTLTGSRRFVLLCIFFLIAARHYVVKPFRIKWLVVTGSLGIAYITFFEIFRNPGKETTESFFVAFYFRLVTYIGNFEKLLSVIPSQYPFMHGKTFYMDILTMLPGKQMDYQSWVKMVTGQHFEGFGAPPTLAGDLYANFGTWGVVIGSFLVGFLAREAYNHLIIRRKTPWSIVLYVALLTRFIPIVTSGLSTQINLCTVMLFKLICIAVSYALARYLLRNLRRSSYVT